MSGGSDFPDLPAFCRIPQEERKAAWGVHRLRTTKNMAFKAPADKPAQDPGTAQLLAERRARIRADEKAERLRRKEERLIRERRKPKPAGPEPATKETEMKKTKKLPNTHPAVRGAKKGRKVDRRQNVGARKIRTGSVNISTVRATGKLSAKANLDAQAKIDVVQQIAGMMAGPNGASMAEMVKATGIEAHPMRAKIKLVRDRLGYLTTAPCKGNGYRYHATPPKKAEG